MKKIFNDIKRLAEFENDLKKLPKKFRTLEEDLEVFIEKQLQLFHKLRIDNKGIFPISDLGITYPKIYKTKKFACKSLKGRGVASGIRIIYAYFESEDIIELIEIYYKGDEDNEDRERILKYYSTIDENRFESQTHVRTRCGHWFDKEEEKFFSEQGINTTSQKAVLDSSRKTLKDINEDAIKRTEESLGQ